MTSPGLFPPQSGDIPHAEPSPLTAPFWQGCAVGELRFQRCSACSAPNFPPTEHCRSCTSAEMGWECSAGRGRLYSWTIVHRAATPAFETPYAPAIVHLDEGYQMLTNLIEVSVAELRVDLEVYVTFRQVDGEGFWLPYFTRQRGTVSAG